MGFKNRKYKKQELGMHSIAPINNEPDLYRWLDAGD